MTPNLKTSNVSPISIVFRTRRTHEYEALDVICLLADELNNKLWQIKADLLTDKEGTTCKMSVPPRSHFIPRDLRLSQRELRSYLQKSTKQSRNLHKKMEKLPTLQCEREKAAATADDSHSANRLLKSSTSITSSKWSWPGVRLSSNTTPEDPPVRQQEDSR